MTGRARFLAAARGEQIDRQPILALGPQADADGIIVSIAEVNGTLNDPAQLALIEGPLARHISQAPTLLATLKVDPERGQSIIEDLFRQTRAEIRAALSSGADGIAYVVEGASPRFTTPMEYGGYFLEVDRMLLQEAEASSVNLLWIKDEIEPYVDFVSDLPAHLFSWAVSSKITVSQVKALRPGPVAFASLDAEIYFSTSPGEYQARPAAPAVARL